MSIETWNIQEIATKTDELFREIKRSNMDIVGLTEAKKNARCTEERHVYIHIYSSVPKEERARSGVSTVQMDLKGHLLSIIVAYAPNNDANMADKDAFCTEMTKLLEKISDRKEIMMIGDLNARTGWRVDDPIVELYDETTRVNRTLLKILNGWFKHKQIYQYTWRQSPRKLRSIIDYIVTKQKSRHLMKDVRTFRGFECGSDHHLLVAKIYLSFKRKNESHENLADPNTADVRYNLYNLQDKSTRFLYQLRLPTKLLTMQDDTVNNMYQTVKKKIHKAAFEALGERQ
ncbi:hypothetical protein ILUMI_13721 [Ignelater luminosus]|uniref:Endonuclease/exonuclease/phosphatase domain-containing protein n=1 Tax=Ignelater luminosus TaxID=2038154 RepID=A0A8K0G8E2_IGNLU|nr:hypothetical protein ILUMI_13721 [Ignelater luminosus]